MPYPPIDPPAAERQSLDQIRAWHRDVADALRDRRAAIQRSIRDGATDVPPQFAGMTEADVDQHHDHVRDELDRLTVLNLVASGEASIRVDYARRAGGKGKGPLSVTYRAWHRALTDRKQRRPDFDEGGILDELRSAGVVDNHLIGRFRECLRPRHWVGHGRYWDRPAEVDKLDPDEVYDRVRALLVALRAVPN